MSVSSTMHCRKNELEIKVGDQAEHGRPETIVLRFVNSSDICSDVTVFMDSEQLENLIDVAELYLIERAKRIDAVDDANFDAIISRIRKVSTA